MMASKDDILFNLPVFLVVHESSGNQESGFRHGLDVLTAHQLSLSSREHGVACLAL
jgi:hypothetical protein